MDPSRNLWDAPAQPQFQPLKLHVKLASRERNPGQLEPELRSLFSDFGQLDDLKVLQNSRLSRGVSSLCFCNLPRRIRPSRNALPDDPAPRQGGGLTSSKSAGPSSHLLKHLSGLALPPTGSSWGASRPTPPNQNSSTTSAPSANC